MAILAQTAGQGLHAQEQIFLNSKLWNDISSLGNIADTLTRPLIGWLVLQDSIAIENRTTFLLKKADDCLQERGFAHTITANQANHLPFGNGEIHIAQDMAFPIINIESVHGQDRSPTGW